MENLLKRKGECSIGSGCGKRELEIREQKLKTLREETKLEFIWIHIKLIGSMNSYGSHKFRLHSGLEMLVASRWETGAARGQKSGLLKSWLWCVALLLLLQMF